MKLNRSIYTLLVIMSFIMMVRGEDDDNVLAEIATDLFIGAAVEICSAFYVCHMILLTFVFISCIFICIGLCSGDIAFDEVFNCKNARRGGTVMVGRDIVRRWR
jgi:hypothetical protein